MFFAGVAELVDAGDSKSPDFIIMGVQVPPPVPLLIFNFMKLEEFNFKLPAELIAKDPLEERSSSQLMILEPTFHTVEFKNIIDLLNPQDVVVINDTKVIKARALGNKPTGSNVEIFLERITSKFIAQVQTRSNSAIKESDLVILKEGVEAVCLGNQGNLKIMKFSSPVREYFTNFGKVPLPPYIKRKENPSDIDNYQTVYADPSKEESVAAPTAGLHFDEKLLSRIEEKGISIAKVTLHVGMGTFSPIRSEDLENHNLHSERIEIEQEEVEKIYASKKKGGRVVCIGTTSLRCLEGITNKFKGKLKPYSGETNIFIKPGYNFNLADCLVTNFHLPKSSLFLLVSAFSGSKNIIAAYEWAIKKRYRFYSYGDAMFLNIKR